MQQEWKETVFYSPTTGFYYKEDGTPFKKPKYWELQEAHKLKVDKDKILNQLLAAYLRGEHEFL